jgi:hypothetical protein
MHRFGQRDIGLVGEQLELEAEVYAENIPASRGSQTTTTEPKTNFEHID